MIRAATMSIPPFLALFLPLLCFDVLMRIPTATGEMFTAVVELERAIKAENQVALALRAFAEQEQQRINSLRRLADDYEQHSLHALINPEKHLSNPVNAFLVVKRFTTDWDNTVNNFIRNSNATDEFLSKLNEESSLFPTKEDLTGVTDALLRLQDTYALPASKITSGDLHPGLENTAVMSVEDCFEIGRLAYLKNDFYHTVLWMREALRMIEAKQQSVDMRAEILDHLAFANFMQGDVQGALDTTNELLELEPLDARIKANKQHYLKAIADGQQSVDPTLKVPTDEYRASEEYIDYERLCRGEPPLHQAKKDQDLTCQYRRHHPMFYINPLREEVLNANPRIVVYHNAVVNSEIEKVREMATPRLKRATVQNPLTGNLETATYRVSKSAWLKDFEDHIIRRISDRAKAMANLTGDTVEELQVVNYGIGGHYEPHFDHARKSDSNSFDDDIGNRIATFICYLTDVEAGGATVFNVVGARVVPEKGSCAIWFNLHRNGEGNVNTRHAACPVLVGSKWVMNKWFHERGEEFVRPCSLSESE